MNIRKRSVRTAARPHARMPIARAISIACIAITLVACSTGQAPEANQGQEADAQRTSVVSNMQATRTWEIINGSPESTPSTPEP